MKKQKSEKNTVFALANKLYVWLSKKEKIANKMLFDPGIKEYFQLLEPGVDVREKQKQFVIEKLKLGIYVVVVGVFLSCLLWIKQGQSSKIGDNILVRTKYGEGSQTINLQVKQEDDFVDVDLVLEEKVFTEEELEALYMDFQKILLKQMLSQNVSLQYVSYDLQFPKEIEGYPFEIEWYADGTYIGERGNLLVEELDTEQTSEVRAKMYYPGFAKEEVYLCQVYSKAIKSTFQEKMTAYLQSAEETSRQEENMVLPTQLEGKSVTWKKQTKHQALLAIFAIPFLLVLLMYCKDNDVRQLVEKRQEQMIYDYPEIVSKLALFIGAGMTIQNAWQRIAWDYQKTKGEQSHYAYEEMLITVREMENGLSQQNAFENFGRRCRHPLYLKLATLLAQHVKKGSTNMAQILQQESASAFEERKHQVRQQGEKAGTKLLGPMMILLFLIMIMILVPAFLNQA